jgi:hypothetical protein
MPMSKPKMKPGETSAQYMARLKKSGYTPPPKVRSKRYESAKPMSKPKLKPGETQAQYLARLKKIGYKPPKKN